MKPSTKRILLQFDEIDCYEKPSHFNSKNLKKNTQQLTMILEDTLKLKSPLTIMWRMLAFIAISLFLKN
jgi:hypothetical protein